MVAREIVTAAVMLILWIAICCTLAALVIEFTDWL